MPARGARGAQFLSPAAANLEKVLWKYIFWSNLAKTTLWSTLSAMSIVGEPSILLLRHIQTSPLTPHALNSSAAKKVLFIFHHWFCYHATLSQSGSDLKQLTLICSRKTNFFSQFPTFWLTSRSSSSWRQVWGGSGSSAGSLPLHISTDGHGGHTAEPIGHRHALSSPFSFGWMTSHQLLVQWWW